MRPVAISLWIPILFISLFIFLPRSSNQTSTQPPVPTPTSTSEANEQVKQAILDVVTRQQENILAFLVNEVQVQQVDVSEDGDWAIGWLTMASAQTGDPVPTEPGLVIARKTTTGWDVFLPTDPLWLDLLIALPADLIDPDLKQVYVEMNANYGPVPSAVYGGYRLPWPAGQIAWLSGSTSHDAYIPSGNAHYAFDFYIPQTMYRLYASKAGIVWRAKWDTPNFDASGTGNYIVLQDNTTSPPTYQLYLHLAQDTIPVALRQPGTYVAQGQYIGMADDTGQSTGHHLHFQVHTNPDSYWGRSVDITFQDVAINGGRPRVKNTYYNDQRYCWPSDACSSFQSSYVSGNVVRGDVTPPTGDLFEPATGTMVSERVVHVEGWASDIGSGLEKAQLIALYQNSWHEVGSPFSTITFSQDWDMCADHVPDGPVSLALRAWDKEANPAIGLPGLRHITKDYSCDSPQQGQNIDASFSYPKSGDFLNATGEIMLEIKVNTPALDINKVEFSYHSGNWLGTSWQVLGSDTSGTNGWTYIFNAGPLLERKDVAFYASIFDVEGGWTGVGAWEIGIDRTAPVTNLASLPAQQSSNAVLLKWTASDNLSGLDYLNLQSQIGSGAWENYSPDPSGSSSQLWFVGVPGSNLGFRLRGVDRADNTENYPLSSESRTTIPYVSALCASPDTWDNGKNDNTTSTATLVEVNSPSTSHNFCNPLTSNRESDEDWIKFSTKPGHTYLLRAVPTAEMVAVVLDLFPEDGTTLISHAEPARFGGSTQIIWDSVQPATIYLRARHLDGRVIGATVAYQVSVQENIPIYLPIVER